MPPEGSRCIEHEVVDERLARQDGTLGDAGDAVHPRGAFLLDAMPVDGGRFGREVVDDADLDAVADVALERRAWEEFDGGRTSRNYVSIFFTNTKRNARLRHREDRMQSGTETHRELGH